MKHYFFYSFGQDCVSKMARPYDADEYGINECFVKTNEGWKQYSEWRHEPKSNWDDAVLIFETEEEPQTKVKYRKTHILIQNENQINTLKNELNKVNNNWEELKQYVINIIQSKNNSPKYYKLNEILDKMKELERKNDK